MNQQPTAWWWAMMTLWSLIAVIGIAWLYRRVKREDEQLEARLPRDPMKYEGRDLSPAQLRELKGGPDNRWQQNARNAEALGFMDDEPTKVDVIKKSGQPRANRTDRLSG